MPWHHGEGARGPGEWPKLAIKARVEHAHFGEGVVTAVHPTKVTIVFPEPFGTKILNLAYTELRILDAGPGAETDGQETPPTGPK